MQDQKSAAAHRPATPRALPAASLPLPFIPYGFTVRRGFPGSRLYYGFSPGCPKKWWSLPLCPRQANAAHNAV